MKKIMMITILILIMTLVFTFSIGSFSDKGSDDPPGDDSRSSSSGHGSDDPPGDDSRSFNSFDDSSSSSFSGNPEYMALVAEKKRLTDRIDLLKDQIDDAEDRNDSALEARLELELRNLKNQKDAVEAKMRQFSGNDGLKPFDDSKHGVESELNTLKIKRDAVERELLRLRAELRALVASGSNVGQDTLRQQIATHEALKDSLQLQIRERKSTIKGFLRKLYSDDEWSTALRLQSELDRIQNVRSLPVNSILITGKEVKLDTPPVISSGRTLIPVRAIATSLGATVLWDEREQKVTIQQGTTILEFEIGDDSMKVNGKSVHLDVPAQIMNGRTVIPLRALVESLNLNIEWDDVTQTIEIM